MGNFSTYGMAGIGIASALGFIFALTVLNTTNPLGTPQGDTELTQRQPETQPGAPSSFFIEQEKTQDRAARLSDDQSPGAGGDNSQQEMALMQQEPAELRPRLSSLYAVDGTNGQVIGEVVPGMQFVIGKPIFIQADFINLNGSDIIDHTIILSLVRNDTGQEPEQAENGTRLFEHAANFRGDIRANGNVELELYWNPDIEGKYVLLLVSLTANDLSDPDAVQPVRSIPINAIKGK
jgi:hypothetical protein